MAIDWTEYGVYPSDAAELPTDWVFVASIDDGGGYDWTTFNAFYSPTEHRYFWHGGSGCSCYGWGDDLKTVADFENGDKAALTAAIRAFAADYTYGVEATRAIDAVADVARFRP